MNPLSHTAAQSVLIAAADLAREGKAEFTEWDLTVAAWERDPNRFGLRGYEKLHPDHKRVMMEIMGQAKKDNVVRRGWIEKANTNRYRITALGQAEAERIVKHTSGDGAAKSRSPQHVYGAIESYVSHRAFMDYCRNPEEPRTWLGASAFLGLNENTPSVLEQKLRTVQNAITQALSWMDDEGTNVLQRGPVGGGRTIHRHDVEKLREFVRVVTERFGVQLNAIRRKRT
jgi:hypothetical protein